MSCQKNTDCISLCNDILGGPKPLRIPLSATVLFFFLFKMDSELLCLKDKLRSAKLCFETSTDDRNRKKTQLYSATGTWFQPVSLIYGAALFKVTCSAYDERNMAGSCWPVAGVCWVQLQAGSRKVGTSLSSLSRHSLQDWPSRGRSPSQRSAPEASEPPGRSTLPTPSPSWSSSSLRMTPKATTCPCLCRGTL